jgi:hypothetical protein
MCLLHEVVLATSAHALTNPPYDVRVVFYALVGVVQRAVPMTYYRPNVRDDPSEVHWLSGQDIPDFARFKCSIEFDDERKCETPAEYCMFVGLIEAFCAIQDDPGQLLIQHRVGRCRLDFAIIGRGKMINVEVDGESFHRLRAEQDRKRDRWLTSQGWTVMRYTARDVMISKNFARWAGEDVRDFYWGRRSLADIRAGGARFQAELERWYPHQTVPVGTCVACRGLSRHNITYDDYEQVLDCEQCEGTGQETPGKRSKMDWINDGWDWEEEWAGIPGAKPFPWLLE